MKSGIELPYIVDRANGTGRQGGQLPPQTVSDLEVKTVPSNDFILLIVPLPPRFSNLPSSLVSIHSYYSRQNSVTAWDAWILGCLHASFAVCSKGVEKFQIQNPYSQEAQWGQSPFQFINNQLHSKEIQTILRLFLVIAMYRQASSSRIKWITQPPALLAGWEGSLGTWSR